MKTIRLLLYLAVAIPMLISCSNDEPFIPEEEPDSIDKVILPDEEPNSIDKNLLQILADGTKTFYFECVSAKTYSKDNIPGSEWVDASWMGSTALSKLFLIDGKTYTNLELSQFEPLGLPLSAYRRAKNYTAQYMITVPLKVQDGNKITINDVDYEIFSLSNDSIKVVHTRTYTNYDGTTSLFKFYATYKNTNPSQAVLDRILYYEKRADALLDIVRMLRDHFGDFVDVNPYFTGLFTLNESVYNLKKIEENILAGKENSWEGVSSAAK